MDKEQAAKLRKPFDKAKIEKLPKAGMQLDYISHATTTDRLLEIDPDWTWHPMGLTPEGLPAFDSKGGLWINLTVCGVTRPGYGEPGRIGPKEAIGDAIRNAAMRFGVALDLWAKVDLDAHQDSLPVPHPSVPTHGAGTQAAPHRPGEDESAKSPRPDAAPRPAGQTGAGERSPAGGRLVPQSELDEAMRAHEARSTLDLADPDRNVISAKQVRRLWTIARDEYKLSDPTVKSVVVAVTGQGSTRAIPRYQYDLVLNELGLVSQAVPK